jgi:hypothetical protein
MGARFVVRVRRVDLPRPIVKIFDEKENAREYWRTTALTSIVGAPVDNHLIVSSRLYLAGAVGSRLDAAMLASAGHLKLLETSHPLSAPAKEHVSAQGFIFRRSVNLIAPR